MRDLFTNGSQTGPLVRWATSGDPSPCTRRTAENHYLDGVRVPVQAFGAPTNKIGKTASDPFSASIAAGYERLKCIDLYLCAVIMLDRF
jgi:hypothetical protein